MAFEVLVSVGGYNFPEPSAYSSNTSTLVDSSRNVKGEMVGSVIRDDVSKIEISWKYLTVGQWAMIQQCFRQKPGGVFYNDGNIVDLSAGGKFINKVRFFDQSEGDWIEKNMYVSDRKAGMWRRDPESGKILGWTDCSLSLIEV